MPGYLQNIIAKLNSIYKHVDISYSSNIYEFQMLAIQLQQFGYHVYIVFSDDETPVLTRSTNIEKKEMYANVGLVAYVLVIQIDHGME